jgi:hypothetical protein
MDFSTPEQHFFQDFSDLLKKHAAMDGKFSLWRVHQHHEMEEDEVLHEISDLITRTSTVRVIKKEALPETAFVSQWVVKADGSIKPASWCCD